MRLARAFYRLPVRFDVDRLVAEIRQMSADAWAPHPNDIPGNSSVRLISADGGENDEVAGPMQATRHLEASPYLRQVLASFGVVWSRSRLMRLAPGMNVPDHADINHHWFTRVRVHIPVLTRPEVRFHCGDEQVHMAAGEAWIFDSWRPHRVENPTTDERIHLVADTSGSAPFWRLVAQATQSPAQWYQHRFDPAIDARPMTEHDTTLPVMPAAEVDLLVLDLSSELVPAAARDEPAGSSPADAVLRYRLLLEEFRHDWRQLCALHGIAGDGRADFERALEALREGSRQVAADLVMRTNGVEVHRVLEARVLQHLLPAPASPRVAPSGPSAAPVPGPAVPVATRAMAQVPPADPLLQSPVFIVSAPRAGSTLLFETLAAHGAFATLGGEAHWLVEGQPGLVPGVPGIDSNRLTAANLTPALAETIQRQILDRLQDSAGRPVRGADDPDRPLRFLEKTPKNALRIPFFRALFPDARFIYLWRDPRENISSMIEAWRSGAFITYPALPGRDGPWSMLLPPGWQQQHGRPVEEIAAWQWDITNQCICDDLATLPSDHWTVVRYDELLSSTASTVEHLCTFLGLTVDTALAARLSRPLPLSRHTRTPPAPHKWQAQAELIGRVLPRVTATWQRLQALGTQPSNA